MSRSYAEVHTRLEMLVFPGIDSFSIKDRSSILNMFRWLTLYRDLQGDPLPKPVGTLLELVLMLDLFVIAWFNFNFMANDIPIGKYLDPVSIGDLDGLVSHLKGKALLLDNQNKAAPQINTPMGKAYEWFAAYRNLKKDTIPKPMGTACEMIMMLELMSMALVDYSVGSKTRDAMRIDAFVPKLNAEEPTGHIDIESLKALAWLSVSN